MRLGTTESPATSSPAAYHNLETRHLDVGHDDLTATDAVQDRGAKGQPA